MLDLGKISLQLIGMARSRQQEIQQMKEFMVVSTLCRVVNGLCTV